ncbi:MAG: hypothetical protein Q4B99_00445, partial [Clostridia bacterium]|nr:hypothetical protein [Clostridia bacterium]
DDNPRTYNYTGIHTPEYGTEAYEVDGRTYSFFSYNENEPLTCFTEGNYPPLVTEEEDARYLAQLLDGATVLREAGADDEDAYGSLRYGYYITAEAADSATIPYTHWFINQHGVVYAYDADGTAFVTDAEPDEEALLRMRMRSLFCGYHPDEPQSGGVHFALFENGLHLPVYRNENSPKGYKMCIRGANGLHVDLTLDEALALFADIDDDTLPRLREIPYTERACRINVFDETLTASAGAVLITEHYIGMYEDDDAVELDNVDTTWFIVSNEGRLAWYRKLRVLPYNLELFGVALEDCLLVGRTEPVLDYDAFMARLAEYADMGA